jgi:hypothetical protein
MQQGKMQAFPVTQALSCFSLMNKMMMKFRVGKKEGVQPKPAFIHLPQQRKNPSPQKQKVMQKNTKSINPRACTKFHSTGFYSETSKILLRHETQQDVMMMIAATASSTYGFNKAIRTEHNKTLAPT